MDGQKFGSKIEYIAFAYPDDKILVIGDPNGDLKAVHTPDVHLFLIHPGHEEKSRELFYREQSVGLLQETTKENMKRHRLPNLPVIYLNNLPEGNKQK
jgi:hypothetical protein